MLEIEPIFSAEASCSIFLIVQPHVFWEFLKPVDNIHESGTLKMPY